MKFAKLFLLSAGMLLGLGLSAQTVKGVLVDESTGEALGFATVSLTRDGQNKPAKYMLSDDKGAFSLESVRNGSYVVVAELLGYQAYSKQIKVESKDIDLGKIEMKLDREYLDAAEVSAIGNAVIIKKDTIEYNASSFLTTDNDNLVDLLKKMPGIEVADNGTITVNGQSVSKITIQGKTFFLDDPQIASQNIPAKLVKKLKVIRKKSEQAEFTGIDDGQEETVIDLTVPQGMMNGIVGRVTAGVGHDVPSKNNDLNDWRFSGNAFLGRFSDNTQISLIANANNANVQGATNFSGNMMGNMMGGGMMGGMMGMGGISTNYMGGLNAASNFFDNRMELGGNYNYNNSSTLSDSKTSTLSHETMGDILENRGSYSVTNSYGHNFGLRLEHKFSENTSILFQPSIRFGGGDYTQHNETESFLDRALTKNYVKRNDSEEDNTGVNKNFSAQGFFLFRQRLGIPGRTLTANVNFNLQKNGMDAINNSVTHFYADGVQTGETLLSQNVIQDQQNYSVNTRLTYTEPLGNYFYLEGNYSYNWSKSVSEKNSYDLFNDHTFDPRYSNGTLNLNRRHEIGVDLLFQNDQLHLQAGFSAMPQYTFNSTKTYNMASGAYVPQEYEDNRWNFSPQVMMFYNFTDDKTLRFFYRGTSSQPSIQQLQPTPDPSNVLNQTLGNPSLTPYFQHNINAEYRSSNRVTFSSFNIRANGGFTQNPIVNMTIRDEKGVSYSIPFNGPTTKNAGFNMFSNTPLGRGSAFSINNNTGANWNQSFSFEGVNVDMSKFYESDFYDFINEIVGKFADPAFYKAHVVEHYTDNYSVNERLRLTYRGTSLQASIGASTNMNHTQYRHKGDAALIAEYEKRMQEAGLSTQNSTTWTNMATAELTWNWTAAGMSLSTNANYRWYNGFTTPQDPQMIINATISKTIGAANLSLYVSDLLGQSRNLRVTDSNNRHVESLSKTLGRYIILSFSYNFGSMGRGAGRGRMGGGMPGGRGGRGGRGGGMPMGGPMMGGGRPMM